MKRIEETERLLIVVDMVKGFIDFGNMADPGIRNIVPRMKEVIEDFLEKEDAVFFIRDSHPEGAAEFEKFPVHCLEGDAESELIEELMPYEEKGLTFKKNSTSAMFAEGFQETLSKMKKLKEVVVCGCCSDICVINLATPLSTFFDELNQKVKVWVPSNLMETFDSPVHGREAYNAMTVKMLNLVGITTEEI